MFCHHERSYYLWKSRIILYHKVLLEILGIFPQFSIPVIIFFSVTHVLLALLVTEKKTIEVKGFSLENPVSQVHIPLPLDELGIKIYSSIQTMFDEKLLFFPYLEKMEIDKSSCYMYCICIIINMCFSEIICITYMNFNFNYRSDDLLCMQFIL